MTCMNRMEPKSEIAFEDILKGKSDRYLIALVQRVVVLLKEHEKTLPYGLKGPYTGEGLEAYLQSLSHSREKLLELVKFVYADPYLSMIQAQDLLTRTISAPKYSPAASPIASPAASPELSSKVVSPKVVSSEVASPSVLFEGFTPKISPKIKGVNYGGAKKRQTRQKRRRSYVAGKHR
jgi:hypothetical protein